MKTVYIRLHNKKYRERYVDVPVRKGQFVTNKHGFVVPMRPYNNMNTIHVDILEEQFESPRALSC